MLLSSTQLEEDATLVQYKKNLAGTNPTAKFHSDFPDLSWKSEK